jgi:hypothetical protein
MEGAVKITKVGAEPKILIPKLESKKPKTIRSFPKGILKSVKNPSKQPPIKRGKTTVRIRFKSKKHPELTRNQEKEKLKELGIGGNLPRNLQKEVLKAAMEAGLISS